MTQTFSLIRWATWSLAGLLLMAGCKNDSPQTVDGEEDRPVLERERTGNKVSFEVRDFSGEPIPVVVVFEELDASGGAVYRFEHGMAQVIFQSGGTYTLQAEGFADLKFKLDQIEDVNRFTFFMHRAGSTVGTASIEGQLRRRNFRPYPHARIYTAEDGASTSVDQEGRFRVQPGPDTDLTQPYRFDIAWTDDEEQPRSMGITYMTLNQPIRLEVYLDTDTPKEIPN
jgi:hypothetical protein